MNEAEENLFDPAGEIAAIKVMAKMRAEFI
jgi:hypothetical protein